MTGATSGIGLETARTLARLGAHVIVAVRDPVRGQAVVRELTAAGGRAELLEIDLSSFASVRRAAAAFLAAHSSLDVLVNNAGVVTRDRQVTADGHERIWQTNFLSHFLLTRLLLEALRRGSRPRVVNVSSEAHRAGRLDWGNLELERGFRPLRAYAQSKLAQVLFTREMARREPGIVSSALHPGAIWTGIWRAAPAPVRWMLHVALAPAAKGAPPVVRLAVAPELDGVSGKYFKRWKEAEPGRGGLLEEDAKQLWETATAMTLKP